MNRIITFLTLTMLLASCGKKQDDNHEKPEPGEEVYYLSNEGAFGYGNASLSLYYPKQSKIVNHAFEEVNGRKPGDVMQSVFRAGDTLFMMMNASNKIEVARAGSIEEIKTLTGFTGPRYMTGLGDGRLAVSCWGGGRVYALSASSLQKTDSVVTGNGPEAMAVYNGRLYVCNSGGFTRDSTVSVIDLKSFTKIDDLKPGDNPVAVVFGTTHLWVLCRGYVEYDASWQVVSETRAVIAGYDLKDMKFNVFSDLPAGQHPSRLALSPDGKTLYYGGGYNFDGIWRYHTETGLTDTAAFIPGSYYGLGVHPVSGEIYAFESPVFTVEGKMKIFSPEGKLLHTFATGIGPNGVLF